MMEKELEQANKEMGQVSQQEKSLSELVSRGRQKCGEAQNSFSSNRNRNRVLGFLMQLKKEGKIKGLYGRLVKLQK